jgi:hypothetical protein
MHPKERAETISPVLPSGRYRMVSCLQMSGSQFGCANEGILRKPQKNGGPF